MVVVWILSAIGVAALVVSGAILSTNLRALLQNRQSLIDAQRIRARKDTARRLLEIKKRKPHGS